MRRSDYDLVIIRHGQSEWNKLNVFTGWRDSPLSDAGITEARAGGKLLREAGYAFDIAYTSVLSRAIKTLWLVLEEMDLMWLPVEMTWRLNERHYGALQGKNKTEAVTKFGAEQVQLWRRGYAVQPPPADLASEDYPRSDPRYASVSDKELPRTESLKDVGARVLPYWEQVIVPQIKAGKKVLITAHGNSLRALLKHLEGLSEDEIEGINLPTGVPKVYKLNDRFLAARQEFLGNPEDIENRIKVVVNQTKRG